MRFGREHPDYADGQRSSSRLRPGFIECHLSQLVRVCWSIDSSLNRFLLRVCLFCLFLWLPVCLSVSLFFFSLSLSLSLSARFNAPNGVACSSYGTSDQSSSSVHGTKSSTSKRAAESRSCHAWAFDIISGKHYLFQTIQDPFGRLGSIYRGLLGASTLV